MSAVGREIDFLCPGQNILSTGRTIKKILRKRTTVVLIVEWTHTADFSTYISGDKFYGHS